MLSTEHSTRVLAEAQQIGSLADNIQILLNKGFGIDEVFTTVGEFLEACDDPTVSDANAYLLHWSRTV